MAEMNPKTAKILTIAGAIDCLIAIVIIIVILIGKSSLPIFIPILLFIAGIMLVFVSLSLHTKK